MQKIQILAIGRDPVGLKRFSTFINENPQWQSIASVDDETAIELFHQQKFDMILLIDEIENESEKKFRSIFSFNNPDLIFTNHSGDSTALLASEIQQALDKMKTKLNIMDDVFKNKPEE